MEPLLRCQSRGVGAAKVAQWLSGFVALNSPSDTLGERMQRGRLKYSRAQLRPGQNQVPETLLVWPRSDDLYTARWQDGKMARWQDSKIAREQMPVPMPTMRVGAGRDVGRERVTVVCSCMREGKSS